MRPSSMSFVSVRRAISRRRPSNDESTTACGVSSMMKSTPVRCSSARMLRPSRPMMRPFMSSDGSSMTLTVVSGVTRGDALQRVGDEIARAPLRLAASVLLEHAHAPGEIVPRQLLPAREQERLRVLERHAGDALERRLLSDLRLLQLFLELLQVDLAVGEPLVLAREVLELALDLLLLGDEALLDLEDLVAPLAELGVDLGAQLDCLLARLHLRLALQRVGLALCVLDDLAAQPAGLADARRTESLHREQGKRRPCRDPDGDSDSDQHGRSSSVGRHRAIRWCSLIGAQRDARARVVARYRAGDLSKIVEGTGVMFSASLGKTTYAGKSVVCYRPDPTLDQASPATSSTVSGSNPRAASQRAVFGPRPRRSASRRARSRSGSRAASASATSSSERPWRSRSKRIEASPCPRSASAAARPAAKRASSTRPARSRVSSASRLGSAATPAAASRSSRALRERSRAASARVARASAPDRRSSRASVRAVSRSSVRPTMSPAPTTASTGMRRHGPPSSSTSTLPRGSSRSAVTVRAFCAGIRSCRPVVSDGCAGKPAHPESGAASGALDRL